MSDMRLRNTLEPFAHFRPDDTPEPFSLWQHIDSKAHYRVLNYPNGTTTRPDTYPRMVHYMNTSNGAKYVRRIEDWNRSFVRVFEQEYDGWVLTFRWDSKLTPVATAYSDIKAFALAHDVYAQCAHMGFVLWRLFYKVDGTKLPAIDHDVLTFDEASAWLMFQGLENARAPNHQTNPS